MQFALLLFAQEMKDVYFLQPNEILERNGMNQDPQHRGRSVGRHQEEEVRELRWGEERQDQDGGWGERQQESVQNSPV